jgi:streptogramin lyase
MITSPLFRVLLPRFLSIPVLCGALLSALPAIVSAQAVSFANTEYVPPLPLDRPWQVAVDPAGNLYIADALDDRILKFPIGNAPLSVLGAGDGFSYPLGLAVDAAGDVFVGDNLNRRVVELPAGGGPAVTLGSGFGGPYSLAVDGAGDVFVVDYEVSQYVLIELPHGGGPQFVVNTGIAGFQPSGVAADAAGDLFIAGVTGALVQEVIELPWTGAGFGPAVVIAPGVESDGLAVDALGDVFIADTLNNRVLEVPYGGGPAVVISTGTLGEPFFGPVSVAVDAWGDVWVSDNGNSRVVEIETRSVNFGFVNVCQPGNTPLPPCSNTQTLNFNVTGAGTLGSIKVLTDGSPNLDFTLAPGSTCTGAVGVGVCKVNVKFAPIAAGLRSGEVELTDTHGNIVSSVLLHGVGLAPEIAFNYPAQPARIGFGWNGPSGVVLDGKGDLFVADSGRHRLVEYPTSGPAFVVGHGFIDPVGLAIDGSGNLYVADEGLSQVVEILASNGSQINLGTGLSYPAGVAVNGYGDVFISDPGNSRVVELPSNGGAQINVGSGLSTPVGLAVDGLGDLFVADPGLSAVIEIGPGGETVLNTGLSAPYGVAVDAAGDVYVADVGNDAIEEILPSLAERVLDSFESSPFGLALDPAGDVYVADTGHDRVLVLPRSQAPSLTFADTYVTQTSSDSPQSVVIQDIGNEPLEFEPLLAGINPNVSAGFTLDASNTCPVLTPTSVPSLLAPGSECYLEIDFKPVVPGIIHGTATVTDDSFNFISPAGKQIIHLEGNGLALFRTHVNLSLASTFLTYPGRTNLTACVTSNFSGPPTGDVLIYDGPNVIATLPLGGDGCAYWYIAPGLSAGTHRLTAAYPGQLPYAPSTSPIVTVIVNPEPVNLSVSCWNPSFDYGANYTCSVSVSSNDGTPPGDITYKYDGNPLVHLPIGGGTLTFTILRPNVGNHTVVIDYPGAPNFSPAGPFIENFTVDPAPVNVQVVPSSWYQSAGFPFTFTATVTSWSAGPPDHNGFVSFYDGAHLIGTVPVNNHGVAAVTTHLHEGTHTITANYFGGVNYATGSGTATVTASH